TVTGLASINGGTYLASTGQQTFNGGLTVAGGTFNASSASAVIDVNGNVTVTSGTLSAPASTSTTCFTVSGNWEVSGTGVFTHNSGTVNLNGTGTQTVTAGANSDFFNLNCTTGGQTVSLLSAINVYGTLTVGSTSGNMVTMGGNDCYLYGTSTPLVLNGTYNSNPGYNIDTLNIHYCGTIGLPGGTYGTIYIFGPITVTLLGNVSVYDLHIFGIASQAVLTTSANNYSLTVRRDLYVGEASHSNYYGKLIVNNSAIAITRNVTIEASDASGTNQIDATGTSSWTVGGSWTNNDTFTYGSSTVTFNGNDAGQTINAGSSGFYALTINSPAGTGAWTLDTSNLTTLNTLNVTKGTLNTGTLNLGAGTSTTINVNGGTLTGGSGTIAARTLAVSGGTLIAGSGGVTLGVSNRSGIYTHTAGTVDWTTNNSLLTYRAAGAITLPADNYYSVSLNTLGSTGSSVTYSLSGTTIISGNLTITNVSDGVTLDIGANDLTVNGDLTLSISGAILSATTANLTIRGNWINSGTFTCGTGTVIFDGNTTISGSSTNSFNNVTINNTKTLVAPSANINVAGNWTNSGTFTHSNGTVTFNGDASGKTINAGSSGFYTLTINSPAGTGAWTLDTNSLTTLTTLNVTKGTLNTATLNLGSAGSTTINVNGGTLTGGSGLIAARVLAVSSGTLTAGAGGVELGTSSTHGNPGTYTHTGGIVDWTTNDALFTYRSNDQINLPADTYHSVTLYASTPILDYPVFNLTADTILEGTLTISNGTVTLSAGTYNLTIRGNWINSGTFICGTGTVNFNGAADQTLSGTLSGSTGKFFNLIMNNTGTSGNDDVILGASIDITGTLTLTDGDLNLGTYTTTLDGDLSYATAASIDCGTSTFVFNGVGKAISGTKTSLSLYNVTVNAGKSVTDNINNTSIAGTTFTVNGTFTVGDGKGVAFYNANQTLAIGNGGLLQGIDVADSIFMFCGETTPTITLTGTGNFGSNLYLKFYMNGDVTYGPYIIPSVNYKAGKVELNSYSSGYITNTFTPAAGTLDIDGDFILNCTSDFGGDTLDFNNSNNTTINIGGSFIRLESGGTAKYTKGTTDTITFDGAGTQSFDPGASSTFNNITHSGAGTLQLINTNLTVGGAFTNSTGTFDANTKTVTVTGLASINGGTYQASTALQTFNGGLTIGGGTFTSGAAGAVDVNGAFALNSGTFTQATSTLNVSGNFTVASGAVFIKATDVAKALTLDGAGNISDANATSNDLGAVVTSGTGTTTMTSKLTLTSLSIGNGTTFNLGRGSYTLTILGTGT
ncbi:MAG: hypothetical protein PHQ43_11260, partial [Dehalococcoidales bacterium]|nr:hypothetical protein [Dehalococcoidales bacterium]